MSEWADRPFEVANLVNPAFTGILLREFAAHYEAASSTPPELLLAFLALPIVLHDETREHLPPTTSTKHHVWLEGNLHLRVGFAERCRVVSPHVRESLSFSVAAGWLSLVAPASFCAEKRSIKSQWRTWDETVPT